MWFVGFGFGVKVKVSGSGVVSSPARNRLCLNFFSAHLPVGQIVRLPGDG